MNTPGFCETGGILYAYLMLQLTLFLFVKL
mgnify:CR=1 FL=1